MVFQKVNSVEGVAKLLIYERHRFQSIEHISSAEATVYRRYYEEFDAFIVELFSDLRLTRLPIDR